MPHLLLTGTASIQEYIFRSNRLRENLGASDLVGWASQWWAEDGRKVLEQTGGELLYVGGGNAAMHFPGEEAAKAATAKWSRELLEKAPGLRVVSASETFDNEGLKKAWESAQWRIVEEENRPPAGSELGALPWVRRCPSTGLAASERAASLSIADEPADGGDDGDKAEEAALIAGLWISADAQAKRERYWNRTRRRVRERYQRFLGTRFDFPRDAGKLGTIEGASQIALVHADGNGVGQWIQERLASIDGDQEFEAALKDVSGKLTETGKEAFGRLIQELAVRIEALESEEVVRLQDSKGNRKFFPLRPIVDDGDDLTFLCHGKLGIALAARYLELFAEESAKRGLDLTACAGVVIFPQKFPFAQAYALVEQVCGRAKAAYREHGKDGSWLDVHVQAEGRTLDLDQARDGYPKWDNRSFPTRPWRQGPAKVGQPAWSNFTEIWKRHKREKWPRHELKRLYEAYADGRNATQNLVNLLSKKMALPAGDNRGTFDVLELLDHYYPVFPEKLEGAHADAEAAN